MQGCVRTAAARFIFSLWEITCITIIENEELWDQVIGQRLTSREALPHTGEAQQPLPLRTTEWLGCVTP
jgi:hypothetical protein